MRLTKTTIAGLNVPDGKKEITYYDKDLPGFGLRARSSGKRSWVAVYRLGKKVRRDTLGDVALVTPDQARAKAKRILAKANLGEDSLTQRKEERARSETTLGIIVETYVRQYVELRLRPKTQHETKRYLRKSWGPLHPLPLHQIARRDVAARLAEIVEHHGPMSGNRARAALHGFFVWAMQQGLVEANPIAGTAAPAAEIKRDRVLSYDELRAVWTVAEDLGDFGTIVLLLILTGQRREEVGGMTWQELDFEKALWSIPTERSKNRQAHEVPLSSSALMLLRNRQRHDKRDLVFGVGKGPFSGWSKAKARLDLRSGVQNWRLHDLRRTVVTGMAETGIQPHIIEAVVNHISGHKAGIAGVYNRATYASEKRSALAAWANHVQTVVDIETE